MSAFLTYTVLGVVTGSIYAVAASGLVVTYTTSGVFNFANGGIGMMAAFLYWELRINRNLPAPLALFLVVFGAAPLFGALIERFLIRNLRGSSQVTYIVVTIGLMLGLIGAANTIWPPSVSRQVPEFFGSKHIVRIAGVNITWHQLTTVAVAALVALLLRLLLYRTRLGVSMRAQVDDRDLTALNGARPDRISTMAWALGACLASVAGVLLAPILQLDVQALTILVIDAFAAAMIGRLRSLPLTYVGALLLGLATAYASGYLPESNVYRNLIPAIPTLFLFAVLLFLPEGRLRTAGLVRSLAVRVPSFKMSLVGAAVIVGGAAVLMATLDVSYVIYMASALALGLVMLSLVPLTGYGGQVSLCQMTFAGIGTFVMVKLGTGGSPLAVLAAAAVAAVVGAIVALPTVRLQGLYLALATMAFALLAQNLFFNDNRVFGEFGSAVVHRVKLFGISFADNRAYGVLLAVVFALVGIGVLALRRGPFGRRLAAMKDSPAACATLGMSISRTKLAVFALSAGIAGLAGALLGGITQSASSTEFDMLQSLPILLLAVIWSISAVSGALGGGIALAVFFPYFAAHINGIIDVVFLAIGIFVVVSVQARTASPPPAAAEDGPIRLKAPLRRALFLVGSGLLVLGFYLLARHESAKLQDLVFLATGLAGVTLGRSPDGVAVDIARRFRQMMAESGFSAARAVDDSPLLGEALAEERADALVPDREVELGEPPFLVGDTVDDELLGSGVIAR